MYLYQVNYTDPDIQVLKSVSFRDLNYAFQIFSLFYHWNFTNLSMFELSEHRDLTDVALRFAHYHTIEVTNLPIDK